MAGPTSRRGPFGGGLKLTQQSEYPSAASNTRVTVLTSCPPYGPVTHRIAALGNEYPRPELGNGLVNETMRDRSTWVTVVGVFLAFAIGLSAGWFVGDDGLRQDAADDDRVQQTAKVPGVCLDAIEAARNRLILTDETKDIATEYARLAERSLNAVRDGDVNAVSGIAEEAQDLNRRAGDVLDRSSQAPFSAPARECERAADGG